MVLLIKPAVTAGLSAGRHCQIYM